MDFATWTPFITVAAAISGILLGWAGRSRAINQDIAQQASADALQRADIEFIKRGVDDIRLDQKREVLIVVVALLFIGVILKKTPRVADWLIPWLLTVSGVGLAWGVYGSH
ncbi:phage holin family protein [Brevibacillus sp. RS1.1]|uniref:phage holin family protein n=1 Tax=Brevibacillus sp. RS1.1 TaxID=2738982 RepID=UPI0020C36F5B|nr:phage holin family protein [Brevibacillus sp. RS1.1]